jgi:hypothetical protein
VPLGAFLSLTTLATLLSAQTRLVCTRQMTMDMPGMDMASMPAPGGAISLCPIVLVLSIASIVLTIHAFVLLLLDRDRVASSRSLARFVLRFPVGGTCATIVTLGCGAVATMMAVDGTSPADPTGWLCLAVIILTTAVAGTLVAIALGHLLLSITRSIVLALERALRVTRRIASATPAPSVDAVVPMRHRVHVLAASRGLRAPPPLVR